MEKHELKTNKYNHNKHVLKEIQETMIVIINHISYTYIDDIVDGVIGALNSNLENEIINLGNDSVCSLNEFIDIIESITKKKANINQMGDQKGDVKGTYANIDKAKKLINFNPKIKLEKGLGELYKYLDEILGKV